jgi:hypothetical protein
MIRKKAATYLICYLVLIPLVSCATNSQFDGEWTAVSNCGFYDSDMVAIKGLKISSPPDDDDPTVIVYFKDGSWKKFGTTIYKLAPKEPVSTLRAYSTDPLDTIQLIIHREGSNLSVYIYDSGFRVNCKIECHKIFRRSDIVGPICTWEGTWQTNFGKMNLNQIGDTESKKVSGTYTHDQGKIVGTVSGNKLIGTWSEAPTYSPAHNDAGDVELILSNDCKSFKGNFRYGSEGGWSGGWTGTKA